MPPGANPGAFSFIAAPRERDRGNRQLAFDNLDLSFLCLPSSIKNIAPYAFSGFNPSSVIYIDSPSVTIEGGLLGMNGDYYFPIDKDDYPDLVERDDFRFDCKWVEEETYAYID